MWAMNSTEFVTRPPTHDDESAILALMNAYDLATVGQRYTDARTVVEDWEPPGFNLAQDARLVLTSEGKVVGYECILGVEPTGKVETDGYVHPEYASRGIGTYLLRWAEDRARERLQAVSTTSDAYLQAGTYGNEPLAQRLFEAEGYGIVRHFWHMLIDLTDSLPEPNWPTGITVRTYQPGQDEYATWQAMNEIFTDEWNYTLLPFEEWLTVKVPVGEFDPTLWFLAMDGDQIAGMSRGMYRRDEGWIRTFGLRPAWRKRGIGRALIHHSFAEFYRRGKTQVGLAVDSENPTGATAFYERAGMHVGLTFDTYQKPLHLATTPSHSL